MARFRSKKTSGPERTSSQIHPSVPIIQKASDHDAGSTFSSSQRIITAIDGSSPQIPPKSLGTLVSHLDGSSSMRAEVLQLLQARYGNNYVGELLQKKSDKNLSSPQDGAMPVIQSSGGGSSLDADTQSFMESRLDEDFSDVRVHTDSSAAKAARQFQAHAFTTGRDIYFGAGRFQPQTPVGQRLLAHELTHVAQQKKGAPPSDRLVSEPTDFAEIEASTLSGRVAQTETLSDVTIGQMPAALIHRDNGTATAGMTNAKAPMSVPVPVGTSASSKSTASTATQADEIGFDPALLVPLGLTAQDLAALREAYAQGVKAISDEAALMLSKGASAAEVADWAVAARNNLKQQIRDQGPRIIKLLAEARNMQKYGNPLGLTAEELRAMGKTNEQIIESVGRANLNITKWAGRLRIAGRILIAIDIGIAAYKVATAPEVDRPRVLLEEVGAIGGALAGGAVGAKAGGVIGGAVGALFAGVGAVPGAAIGAFIGGVGGAIAGAWGGRKLGRFVATELYPPKQTGFEGSYT
ncbi:MAG: DUF4157 domain-containing protein [bacterium]